MDEKCCCRVAIRGLKGTNFQDFHLGPAEMASGSLCRLGRPPDPDARFSQFCYNYSVR
jgi:hypothetical protein